MATEGSPHIHGVWGRSVANERSFRLSPCLPGVTKGNMFHGPVATSRLIKGVVQTEQPGKTPCTQLVVEAMNLNFPFSKAESHRAWKEDTKTPMGVPSFILYHESQPWMTRGDVATFSHNHAEQAKTKRRASLTRPDRARPGSYQFFPRAAKDTSDHPSFGRQTHARVHFWIRSGLRSSCYRHLEGLCLPTISLSEEALSKV
ncbi:hypothetical protein GE21DRAFT_1354631 [Neurospora crassa]|nr:hypothetical protein GE21DRAFT_1354631 [Neurospora crassa]